MSPLVRCVVCLLAVLWAVGRSGASQPQPSAGVGTALEPDQLLRLIVQDVTANIQPMISRLTARIDRMDSRLIPRLNSIESRLNALDFKQDSFDARLDDLASRVDSEHRPDPRLELSSRLDFVNNSLHTTRDELYSRVIPRPNSIESHLNAMDSKLDSLTSRVNSEGNRLDAKLGDLASRVDFVNNTLHAIRDELVSRVDFVNHSLHSTCDELVSRVNSTEQRLDSKFDEQALQLNSTNNRLNEMVSPMDELADERSGPLDVVSSRLEGLTNLTDPRLQPPPRDCSDLPAWARSGVYLLQPDLDRSRPPVKAYCDLESDGGRWTVIQRRADIQPRQNFNRSWSEYREGFGDLEAEFWWGLDNLHRLTSSRHRQYELRVNLADFDGGRRYASYGIFRVASGADGYRLTVSGYTGNAGNSLGYHSGDRFSTYDRDQDTNDTTNCAARFGGGWWYLYCYACNLNGLYLYGRQDRRGGIIWLQWRGYRYSLKETEMKVRPVDTD